VGPRAGVVKRGKSLPHRDSILGPSSPLCYVAVCGFWWKLIGKGIACRYDNIVNSEVHVIRVESSYDAMKKNTVWYTLMANSEKLVSITKYLTLQARCGINRCRYNRVLPYLILVSLRNSQICTSYKQSELGNLGVA
jgi:hypothetical protein